MVVRKVAKKSVSKKVAKTTKGIRTPYVKHLVSVSGEQCFWVHEGPILADLKDLKEALKHMSDAQFLHHVGGSKNDFSQWVEHVLNDDICAKALRKAKNKKECMKAVEVALLKYA